ncbi:hypothetical protein ACWEOZ_25430 [Actinoplanes sp. NPDC004185]
MTMPGVRVTSVRRTVRVAVALVAGQALLCGVIGFVTFGGDDAKSSGRAAEPQLAGPPIVVPSTNSPPPSDQAGRPVGASTKQTRTERPTSPAPVAVRRSTTRSISPSRTATAPAAPVPPPAPTTSPTNRALLPPSAPAPGDDAPIPVADEPCDDEGATDRTAEGKAVRCERDRNGDLRWRLV